MSFGAIATIGGGILVNKFLGPKEREAEIQQVQTLNPSQQRTLGQLNTQGQQFLNQPGGQQGNLAQLLQRSVPGLAQQSLGAFGQGLNQGVSPIDAQGLQGISDPILQSLMGQFQNQVVPQIANQFGALDSARSSGLADRLGRAGSQLPFQAQHLGLSALGQNNQQLLQQQGQQLQGGLGGLGFTSGLAGAQDQFNQAQRQEQLNRLSLGLGTPAFGNIGLPGTQAASPLAGIGGLMSGMGAMGLAV